MIDVYAPVSQNRPVNTAVFQLSPITHNGNNFYGWKMVYMKRVQSKDKNKKYDMAIDKSKPIVYDSVTQQLRNHKQDQSLLSTLLFKDAQQEIKNKGQSKINSQLMMQIAELKIQMLKGAK